MANPLASFNTNRPQRSVVVYSPGRRAPGQRVPLPPRTGPPAAQTPQQARTSGQRGPGVNWAGVSEAVQSTPAAQRKIQEVQQKAAEDQAYDDLPWYKKGLGMVLGNPVSKTFLYPLSLFSVPGKAITAGVEKLGELYDQWDPPDWVDYASMATGIGGYITNVDSEQTAKDDRSFWEKINPSSDYGYGQLINQDAPDWVKNVVGFSGDVVFDPFTYVTGGAMKGADAIERGAKIAQAAEHGAQAEKYFAAADKIAESAKAGNVAATTAERGRYLQAGAEAEERSRQLLKEVEALGPGKIVPVRQGRKARESIIGEVANYRPDLLAEGSDTARQLQRAAERGFNTLRDPALRETLGLQDPALRFAGMNIPKTGAVASGVAQLGGLARAGANRTPLLGETMAKFSSRGLEDASRVVSRGGKGDVLRAGTAIRIQNLLRRGTASMEGRGNRELTTLIRELKGMGGKDTIKALFRDAETGAAPNRINKFFGHDIPALYEKIAGRPMGVQRNPDTYVPHMMTPEFKRFLRSHASAQEVEDLGFVADDLLEGSQYLEKSRKLEPKVVGEPTEFKIGDRTITLTDGTIDELNDELKRAFPEFKRKAYMDDPATIGEAYVSSIARQAGRDFAMQRMADSPNQLVREISGDVLAAIEARNKWSRTNPIIETVKKGYTAGQRLVPAKPKEEAPTSAFDDMFAWTKHVADSQTQRNYLFKEGKQFVEDVGKDVKATRSTLADNLKALRTQLMDGLKTKAREAEAKIKTANVYLDRVDDEIKKMGPLTSENLDDVVAVAHTVDQQIGAVKDEIRKIRDRYGKRVPRSQQRIEKELQTALDRLEGQAEAVRTQYGKGSAEMRKEAAARTKALQAPIEAAQTRVEQAEARHVRTVTPEQVQQANRVIRTSFETEDAFEAERQLYVEALHQMHEQGIPIYKSVDGHLTPETKDVVRQIVHESKTPPPPAPTRVVPEPPTAGIPAAPVAPPAPSSIQETLLKQRVQDLRNKFRDAVESGDDAAADQIEDQLNAAEEQLRKANEPATPPPPAAAAPTPPPPPDTKLVRQSDGSYASADGFTVHKEGKGWRVMLDGEDDFGLHPTMKEAKKEVEHQQKLLGQQLGTPAVEEVAAPAAAAEVVPSPEPAAATTAAEPGTAPTTKRITRKWTTKDVNGREVAALSGPDEGWTIEPYMQAPPHRRGPAEVYLPQGVEGPRAPAPALGLPEGPGRQRFAAFHPSDDTMRGVTFASEREAKIAVEDMLRKRRYKQTAAEYAARGELQKAPVFSTYTDLAGVRTDLPEPTNLAALTPEERAARQANLDVIQPNVPTMPNVPQPPQRQLVPTEEGAKVIKQSVQLATSGGVKVTDGGYALAYQEWQDMLARSTDTSLTQAERNQARRRARTMGGAFTTTGGKFHERYAAEGILAEEATWQRALEADPEVAAARAAKAKAETDAANQVEAIVYTKHHNPVTGDDEYTRLPSGSTTGFGTETERVPVLPTPPTEGVAPQGTRAQVPLDADTWESRYSQGQRAADRNVIDSGLYTFMPADDQARWGEYTSRADDITDRITASLDNEDRIKQLDQAAKDAYTTEVKQADEAVKEAKRAEEKAYQNWANRDPDRARMTAEEAEAAYDAAQRVTTDAINNQTTVRQAWMDADRAWKQALEQRDAWIQAQADVTKAEQAIHGGRNTTRSYTEGESAGDAFIAKVRETGVAPGSGGHPPSDEARKLARNLVQADQKLEALESQGIVHLDAQERRRLQGQLNDIDLEKRNLINKLMQDKVVKPGEQVLPRAGVEMDKLRLPGQSARDPLGFEGDLQMLAGEPQGTKIPPVFDSTNDLQARAFAESLEPTEPAERTITSLTAEGAPQQTTRISGTREYKPGKETEAIAALQKGAADIESGPLAAEREQKLANIAAEQQGLRDVHEVAKETERLGILAERDEKLRPLADQVQTLAAVQKSLHDKQAMIPERAEALAQRKVIVDAKITKKADIAQVADDIEKVARQNPDMLDDDLAVVEALLQDTRKEAERVTENDLTAKQVQGLIDKVATRDDKSIDIMLTTVGKNWRMLYEANGTKKAVLQAEDIVVDHELHRMFTNLYDLKKDHVLFGRNINAFTNLFKTYATLTPGFHVRNALSAIFMNTADGVGLRTQLTAAELWKKYMEGGEEFLANPGNYKGFTADQIRNAFTVAHSSGAGGRFTEAGFAEVAGEGGWAERLLNRAQRNWATRLSQRAGERVEGSVRLAMALDSMRLGESVESGIQRVNRIHFDYGDISKMDDTMKRIIPFWTFMSRNMPMQVSQMWTHPRTYLIYENFVKNFSAKNEEYTPEYWTKAGVWNTGLKIPENSIPILSAAGGLPIYAAPDLGYTRLKSDLQDYEDFLSLRRPGAVLSQANPILSAPAEYAFRQDIFTGQRFEKGETVPAEGITNIPIQAVARLFGQETGGEVDAALMNLYRAVNPLQDRQMRLLPQLSGGNEPEMKRQLESWLRTGLGVPIRTLTPEQQQNEYQRRYYDQLDAMKRQQERAQRQAS